MDGIPGLSFGYKFFPNGRGFSTSKSSCSLCPITLRIWLFCRAVHLSLLFSAYKGWAACCAVARVAANPCDRPVAKLASRALKSMPPWTTGLAPQGPWGWVPRSDNKSAVVELAIVGGTDSSQDLQEGLPFLKQHLLQELCDRLPTASVQCINTNLFWPSEEGQLFLKLDSMPLWGVGHR